MASLGLPTPRAIGSCSLGQPITFYHSPIHRMTYDTPSTVGETHGAPSTLRASNDTRTRSVAGRSTTGITTSRHGVRPPGPSRSRLRLVAPPGNGRGTTTTTPLPGKDIITDDKKTAVEYQRLLHALGPFYGPLTSRSPTSTNMNLRRIWEAGRLYHCCLSRWGYRGRDGHVLAYRPWARRVAMAMTPTPTMHRRLERLQSALHRQLPISLRQTGATMGPQIHQAPGGRNSPDVP
jgi:hypothetical protein